MNIEPRPALLLRRSEVVALMDPAAYLAAVEAGFRSYARGDVITPIPMHIPLGNGGFHAKGACLTLDRAYTALKVNSNFPDNRRLSGLPTIQGVVLLFDAVDGALLAIMDSIEITAQRTAAASALAARYLAPSDAASIGICGCGDQGRAQLVALAQVVPLKKAFTWDLDSKRANDFAHDMREMLGIDVTDVSDVRDATWSSDIIVTATTARTPFLGVDDVSPGTFIAAVGADNAHKSELAPELMARSKIVVDVLAQSATMGDLHHAIAAGRVTPANVHAELGDLVIGSKPGRTNPEEITIFDSTGVAIEDAASAALVYERAVAQGIGTRFPMGES